MPILVVLMLRSSGYRLKGFGWVSPRTGVVESNVAWNIFLEEIYEWLIGEDDCKDDDL